ncbi:MAG: alginate lyase family protein [Chloroflexota bacterium]
MSEIRHQALYFDEVAVARAREHANREPFGGAWAALHEMPPSSDDPLALAVYLGFQYRFEDDESAGNHAVRLLVEQGAGLTFSDDMSYAASCAVLMAGGHAFEMIRPLLPDDVRRGWLSVFNEHLERLREVEGDLSLMDLTWRTAAKIVGGIVTERSDVLVLGVEDFKQIVAKEIHPEGYFPALVRGSEGGALQRQVLTSKALVLAAEAAAHQGEQLWNYEVRGISVKTTAIYAAAYLEYRDQWPWDEPPDETTNEQFYAENGAFLEMLNTQLPPTVLKDTMGLLRPCFDPYGGGYTTLSHGIAPKRGLFGLLG